MTSSPAAPVFIHESAVALRHAIAASAGRISLAFIDVVGVGVVNRRFGRTAGDRLLEAFDQRLTLRLDAAERVWRLGGDQFVLLMPRRSPRSAARRARSLRRRLARDTATVTAGCEVTLSFRAGGATAGSRATARGDLYAAAATALQHAKRVDADVVWARLPEPPLNERTGPIRSVAETLG